MDELRYNDLPPHLKKRILYAYGHIRVSKNPKVESIIKKIKKIEKGVQIMDSCHSLKYPKRQLIHWKIT